MPYRIAQHRTAPRVFSVFFFFVLLFAAATQQDAKIPEHKAWHAIVELSTAAAARARVAKALELKTMVAQLQHMRQIFRARIFRAQDMASCLSGQVRLEVAGSLEPR